MIQNMHPVSLLQIYGAIDIAILIDLIFVCLTPLSTIFQLYHGDQSYWWKKPEYPERTTDHGQATVKFYHLRLRVECTLFCNLYSRARTHAVWVKGLYELLGSPTTYLIEPSRPRYRYKFIQKWNLIVAHWHVDIFTAVQTFIRHSHRFDWVLLMLLFFFVNKKFKDTKGVIRNCKLKNRQYTGQKKKEKSTNNDLQNTTQKNIDLSKTKATKKKKE